MTTGRLGQQEMVHAPKLENRITDAGGDAGAKRRHQHFVRPLGNLMLAKQNLDGVRAEAWMVIALAGLILMAGMLMAGMAVMTMMAVGWLHDTTW
jgi:hypothetical protein